MRVCPNYKQDEICFYSNDYNVNLFSWLAIANNWLKKQDRVQLLHCPKQG